MLKVCFKCLVEKEIDEFYRHSAMADGRLGKCKECTKQDTQLNYSNHRLQYREYDKQREQLENRKRAKAEYQRRYRSTKKLEYKAHQLVNKALKSGKLQKQSCEECGTSSGVEGHHDDYTKPLHVRWLCFKHHRELGHGQIVLAS